MDVSTIVLMASITITSGSPGPFEGIYPGLMKVPQTQVFEPEPRLNSNTIKLTFLEYSASRQSHKRQRDRVDLSDLQHTPHLRSNYHDSKFKALFG